MAAGAGPGAVDWAHGKPTPAEQALQLLFKKLHPHLEDAAHALADRRRGRNWRN